jgi:hypothetical protein
MELRTDAGGRFVACGVPVGPVLTVQAAFLNRETQTLQVEAREDRPTVANFMLKHRGPQPGRF